MLESEFESTQYFSLMFVKKTFKKSELLLDDHPFYARNCVVLPDLNMHSAF